MYAPVWCDNAEPHDGHRDEKEVLVDCSGRTRCGEQTHEAHTIAEKQNVYCPGVCGCGAYWLSKPHGKGEHK